MASTCPAPVKEKYERLPSYAKPTNYKIRLAPDLSKFVFDGSVAISVKIVAPTSQLRLHAKSLAVHKASVQFANGVVAKDLKAELDEKWSILTVQLPSEAQPQDLTLQLDFTGELNDKMNGFYRSSYKDEKGQEKFLASTQFESTYARLAFPCWDEPIYKSTFDVTLVVDPTFTALSNMNAVEEKIENGKKEVHFATTPIMSTYLVAFAVGELEFVESRTKSGAVTRVYTVPGKKQLGLYSLDLATKAIDWYNEWFGIVYPIPKCDLIAIPDFSMGAMENWGLVTFREVALLYDENKTSTRQKSYIALVVAHELAHLWFGDLVTMKWWTDLWLKEGFASFMEYMFVGANCPEFDIWMRFVNDELARGMDLDSLRSSHPIEVEIDNPNELDEIYDGITYAKSNSVNRMLCEYLSEPVFQKGLRIYLQRFQYSNATTVDLWQALGEASGQDIVSLMSGWTKQMGFPLVTVEERQDGSRRVLKLRQRRFLADGSKDGEGLWQVPINISVASKPGEVKHRVVLKKIEDEVVLEDVAEGDWVKLNAGAAGFFRVQYSPAMLARLLPDVSSKRLPPLDRFNITNDLFALVEAGEATAVHFLELLAASANEDSFIVWQALDTGLGSLSNVLQQADDGGAAKRRFDDFVVRVLGPVGERVGWDAAPGESGQQSMLRSLIHSRLGKSGHAPTLQKARQLFDAYIKEGKALHPDLRLTIFALAVRSATPSDSFVHDSLKKLFETCGFAEVERHCIAALSTSQTRERIQDFYNYAFKEGKVRPQDLMFAFSGTTSSVDHLAFSWPFLKKELKMMLEKFGDVNSSLFQHCFKLATDGHATEKVAKDVEDFCCSALDPKDRQTLDRPIRQIVESIHNNKKLLDRNREAILALP